jgi:hypothetical protein
VSANITLLGVKIYRQLFYIPGFTMFRSFDEKWYYAFAFFYAQLAGLSLYALVQKSKRGAIFVFLVVGLSVLWRIAPFLQGAHYQETIYQSRNITKSFSMDPDLLDALSFVKKIPDNENFLTLPLTLPYFQVINGKEGGAYVGVSTVRYIGGKNDYAGFWYLEPFQQEMFDALKRNNMKKVLQIFSLFNIQYIFRNTDQRVMDDFPKFPFYRYDMTEDIPLINSQDSYDQFLKEFPITTVYEKGHFRISKFDDTVIRPAVYIPDILYASQSGALTGDSFRSAYVEEDICLREIVCNRKDDRVPGVTFKPTSPGTYEVTFEINNRMEPFVVSLAEYYHPSWILELHGENMPNVKHIRTNGYANGWIIDPITLHTAGTITGTMRLDFQRYFEWGRIVSVLSSLVLVFTGAYVCIKTYGFKK